MRRTPLPVALIVLLCFSVFARATDAPKDVAIIAHFVDAGTIAVVRVDLSHVDFAALQAAEIEALDASDIPKKDKEVLGNAIPADIDKARNWVVDFNAAGGRQIYFLLNMQDLRDGPVVAVPLNDGADEGAIKKLFHAGPTRSMSVKHCVLLGEHKTLEAMKMRAPLERPELAAALASAGDVPVSIALIPSDDVKAQIVAMVPQLPASMGRGKTSELISAMKFGWGSMVMPAGQKLRIELQYEAADSAKAAMDALKKILADAGESDKSATARDSIDPVAPISWSLARTMAPHADGDKIVVSLDGDGMKKLSDQAYLLIALARKTSMQIKSAGNLRMIGIGCQLYEMEKGEYPPDMGTLMMTEHLTADAFVNPSTGHTVPENLTKEQQADWVNKNADYIYLAEGLAAGASPEVMVAMEKPDPNAKRVNILFADSHVEVIRATDVDRVMALSAVRRAQK